MDLAHTGPGIVSTLRRLNYELGYFDHCTRPLTVNSGDPNRDRPLHCAVRMLKASV